MFVDLSIMYILQIVSRTVSYRKLTQQELQLKNTVLRLFKDLCLSLLVRLLITHVSDVVFSLPNPGRRSPHSKH